MKPSLLAFLAVMLGTGLPSVSATGAETSTNTLTASERAEGWRLLFDGQTTNGWRSFKKTTFPGQGWAIEEGCLKKIARVRGGDLISRDQFTDFDLKWEWKLPPRANNGLKYFITEERGAAVGHEYQMIDDATVRDPFSSTASFYLVVPPRADKPLRPPGQWNESRVLVQGNHVEHWLNGAKVLEYELGSPAVLTQVAKTKFKDVKGFGTKIRGHVLLTDHGDEAWYRNIRIRELPAP
jgi:hypothetical protein